MLDREVCTWCGNDTLLGSACVWCGEAAAEVEKKTHTLELVSGEETWLNCVDCARGIWVIIPGATLPLENMLVAAQKHLEGKL